MALNRASWLLIILLSVSAGCASFNSAGLSDIAPDDTGVKAEDSGPMDSSAESSVLDTAVTSADTSSENEVSEAAADVAVDTTVDSGDAVSDSDTSKLDSALDTSETGKDSGPEVIDSASDVVDTPIDSPPDSPSVATCKAGTTAGTVDNVAASGAIETGMLIHFAVGTAFYSTTTPTTHTFTGASAPDQLVIYGKEGLQFDLKNGSTATAKPYYKIDLGTLPPECSGLGLKTQSCLSKVAKSFRCQYAPYLEKTDCPLPVTFTAQSAVSFYQDLTPGHKMVLVHLTCPD